MRNCFAFDPKLIITHRLKSSNLFRDFWGDDTLLLKFAQMGVEVSKVQTAAGGGGLVTSEDSMPSFFIMPSPHHTWLAWLTHTHHTRTLCCPHALCVLCTLSLSEHSPTPSTTLIHHTVNSTFPQSFAVWSVSYRLRDARPPHTCILCSYPL